MVPVPVQNAVFQASHFEALCHHGRSASGPILSFVVLSISIYPLKSLAVDCPLSVVCCNAYASGSAYQFHHYSYCLPLHNACLYCCTLENCYPLTLLAAPVCTVSEVHEVMQLRDGCSVEALYIHACYVGWGSHTYFFDMSMLPWQWQVAVVLGSFGQRRPTPNHEPTLTT